MFKKNENTGVFVSKGNHSRISNAWCFFFIITFSIILVNKAVSRLFYTKKTVHVECHCLQGMPKPLNIKSLCCQQKLNHALTYSTVYLSFALNFTTVQNTQDRFNRFVFIQKIKVYIMLRTTLTKTTLDKLIKRKNLFHFT